MYQLLQGLANTMMIFGATMFILGMIALPFEFKYKKKHGPISKNMRLMHIAGLAVAALVITIPLKLSVFKPRKPPFHDIDLSYVQPDPAIKEKAIREAAEKMGEQMDKRAGIQRREITPEQRAAEAKQDAERVQQRREAAEQHATTMRMAQERHAAVRRKMEDMREMRKTDEFRPPEGSTTPEQEELDGKIVAANSELQDLKMEKARLEEEAAAANEAYRALIKSGVADRTKLDELQSKSGESRKAAFDASRGINEKRREVTTLLDQRYELTD